MREHRSHGLNYAEGPPTGPPLVLLHGGAWRWQAFQTLLAGLSTRWHLYALDLPGHGRSDRTPGRYHVRHFADEVARFLEEVVAEPAALVGHSVGGVVAMMAADRVPRGVSALVLEDACVEMGAYRDIVQSNRGLYVSWRDLAASGKSGWELLKDLREVPVELPGGGPTVRLEEAPGATDDWLLFMAGCLEHLDPEFLTTLLEDFDDFTAGYDPEGSLRRAACPVLLVRGEPALGAVLTDGELERARALHPRLAVAHIPEVGHELHMGRAEPVLRAMANFLDFALTPGRKARPLVSAPAGRPGGSS